MLKQELLDLKFLTNVSLRPLMLLGMYHFGISNYPLGQQKGLGSLPQGSPHFPANFKANTRMLTTNVD